VMIVRKRLQRGMAFHDLPRSPIGPRLIAAR
jgi:hypothetical protein